MTADQVLVVEDDLPIRMLIRRALERAGYKTEEAEDGAVAIEKLRNSEYRLILLDLMMPRVDGFGVLDFLNENHPESLKRTIVASAMPMNELQSRLKYDVCQILSKPFEIADLIQSAGRCSLPLNQAGA